MYIIIIDGGHHLTVGFTINILRPSFVLTNREDLSPIWTMWHEIEIVWDDKVISLLERDFNLRELVKMD